jgi:hypothetical protein
MRVAAARWRFCDNALTMVAMPHDRRFARRRTGTGVSTWSRSPANRLECSGCGKEYFSSAPGTIVDHGFACEHCGGHLGDIRPQVAARRGSDRLHH